MYCHAQLLLDMLRNTMNHIQIRMHDCTREHTIAWAWCFSYSDRHSHFTISAYSIIVSLFLYTLISNESVKIAIKSNWCDREFHSDRISNTLLFIRYFHFRLQTDWNPINKTHNGMKRFRRNHLNHATTVNGIRPFNNVHLNNLQRGN